MCDLSAHARAAGCKVAEARVLNSSAYCHASWSLHLCLMLSHAAVIKAKGTFTMQICDFNLSRVMEETLVLSSMGNKNPRWLAPEILDSKDYSLSSDVYSFGMVMLEFLTWQVPWHDCTSYQVRLSQTP